MKRVKCGIRWRWKDEVLKKRIEERNQEREGWDKTDVKKEKL